MTDRPVKTFRDGAIGLSVWERQGKQGTFYDFTLSRSYQDGVRGSGYASTFREENSETIVRVVTDAATWIRERLLHLRAGQKSFNEATQDHMAMVPALRKS